MKKFLLIFILVNYIMFNLVLASAKEITPNKNSFIKIPLTNSNNSNIDILIPKEKTKDTDNNINIIVIEGKNGNYTQKILPINYDNKPITINNLLKNNNFKEFLKEHSYSIKPITISKEKNYYQIKSKSNILKFELNDQNKDDIKLFLNEVRPDIDNIDNFLYQIKNKDPKPYTNIEYITIQSKNENLKNILVLMIIIVLIILFILLIVYMNKENNKLLLNINTEINEKITKQSNLTQESILGIINESFKFKKSKNDYLIRNFNTLTLNENKLESKERKGYAKLNNFYCLDKDTKQILEELLDSNNSLKKISIDLLKDNDVDNNKIKNILENILELKKYLDEKKINLDYTKFSSQLIDHFNSLYEEDKKNSEILEKNNEENLALSNEIETKEGIIRTLNYDKEALNDEIKKLNIFKSKIQDLIKKIDNVSQIEQNEKILETFIDNYNNFIKLVNNYDDNTFENSWNFSFLSSYENKFFKNAIEKLSYYILLEKELNDIKNKLGEINIDNIKNSDSLNEININLIIKKFNHIEKGFEEINEPLDIEELLLFINEVKFFFSGLNINKIKTSLEEYNKKYYNFNFNSLEKIYSLLETNNFNNIESFVNEKVLSSLKIELITNNLKHIINNIIDKNCYQKTLLESVLISINSNNSIENYISSAKNLLKIIMLDKIEYPKDLFKKYHEEIGLNINLLNQTYEIFNNVLQNKGIFLDNINLFKDKIDSRYDIQNQITPDIFKCHKNENEIREILTKLEDQTIYYIYDIGYYNKNNQTNKKSLVYVKSSI